MGIKAFLENGFGAKTKVVSIWKQGFSVFCKFLSDEVETILGKDTQSVQNYLNQNMGIRTFLENGFRATLSSNSNVGGVWKKIFAVFCKFLSDKAQTLFWQTEAKSSRLFKSMFGHMKLLTKCFWSNLELKNKCSDSSKKSAFQFLANFLVTKLRPFSGKVRQRVKIYSNQSLGIRSFLENSFGATFSSKTNVLNAWKKRSSVSCQFLNHAVKSIFWESPANPSKLFKSKYGHKNLLKKWFWRENECCERLRKGYFGYLPVFGRRSWNHFWKS